MASSLNSSNDVQNISWGVPSKDALNTTNLLNVAKRVVFVRNENEELFNAKMKLENNSSRFVSFVVRSSNGEKFRIKPRYGFIRPRQVLEINVWTTRDVEQFKEISKEFFGVFAVPIYDKRQLERKKLSLLWRAHGTELFPLEAAEYHQVPYILPKSDNYFNDLSVVGRICEMSLLSRLFPKGPEALEKDKKVVSDETFLLNWPSETPITEDPTMENILYDWRRLSKKIQAETQSIHDSFKMILAILVSAGTTSITLAYLYMSETVPFCLKESEKAAPIVATPSAPGTNGWFTWFRF